MAFTVDADQYACDQRKLQQQFYEVNRRIDELHKMIGNYTNHRLHFTDPNRNTISSELKQLHKDVEKLHELVRK